MYTSEQGCINSGVSQHLQKRSLKEMMSYIGSNHLLLLKNKGESSLKVISVELIDILEDKSKFV